MSVFGKTYSSAYDTLYGAKDYARECDMIESLLGSRDSHFLLDIGCGTGGHAVHLARRGHHVLGVDRSLPMLEIARQKTAAAGLSGQVELLQGDLRTLNIGRTFDAAIMMFAVLGYQETDKDVADALAAVGRHLKPGGEFIFDIWYGPAVIADPPGARRRTIETPQGRVVRTTESRMKPGNLCDVGFTLERYDGDSVAETTRENHIMRYFYLDELQRFAASAGFICERIRDFNDLEKSADATTWNAVVLFRKC